MVGGHGEVLSALLVFPVLGESGVIGLIHASLGHGAGNEGTLAPEFPCLLWGLFLSLSPQSLLFLCKF